MHKMCKIIVSTMILLIILTGCSKTKVANNPNSGVQGVLSTQSTNEIAKNKTYKYFATPEKIIFYNHGKEKDIEKGSDLYNNILALTDKRFNNQIVFYKSATEIESLNKMELKALILEFVYSDIKETEYQDYYGTKKYKRLLMPLSGNLSNYLYFDDGEEYSSSPIGTLSPPDEVIDTLK